MYNTGPMLCDFSSCTPASFYVCSIQRKASMFLHQQASSGCSHSGAIALRRQRVRTDARQVLRKMLRMVLRKVVEKVANKINTHRQSIYRLVYKVSRYIQTFIYDNYISMSSYFMCSVLLTPVGGN